MIKKMLYDRKGVAIELAILMTAVCLAVTTIVLSTALLQYENKVQAEQKMEENIIFEQIVEKWLQNTSNDVFDYKEDGYVGEVSKTNNQPTKFEIFEIDEAENKTIVLTIEIKDGTITSWEKG